MRQVSRADMEITSQLPIQYYCLCVVFIPPIPANTHTTATRLIISDAFMYANKVMLYVAETRANANI